MEKQRGEREGGARTNSLISDDQNKLIQPPVQIEDQNALPHELLWMLKWARYQPHFKNRNRSATHGSNFRKIL